MKASRSDVINVGTIVASTTIDRDPITKINPTPSSDSKLKCCPINNTFTIVGKKFTILILRNMINGKQIRFNQILNSIEDSNPKTFSLRRWKKAD